MEENVQKLAMVLKTASEYGLIINWKKCQFLVTEVEYLGYLIKAGRYYPSGKKTEAVAKFPKPKTVKQIQSFLGPTGYFRKFIFQFAIRAHPISNLLRNNVKFEFGSDQEAAFEDLKGALIDRPVLRLYRIGAETELHTDACMGGLGTILLQRNPDDNLFHPIYYASWKTSPAEEKYTSFELEMLAVVKALKKFRIYLLGIPFKIITDCRAVAMTMKKKDTCLRVSHWVLLLEQFQYTIEHRPGTAMKHVDALSRNPVTVLCIDQNQDTLIIKIQRAQQEDPELLKFIGSIKQQNNQEFKLKGQKVLYRESNGIEQLVVPRSMQREVIHQAHDRGHFGWKKTEYSLMQEFWFPKMREKIQKYIENCIQCLLAEKKRGKAEGWLNPIGKGDKPLDTYHVDHLGPMPSTKKSYNHLYVVVDAFTKFVWIYPTKSTTAEEVITRMKRQAVTFGNPQRIISDRGTAFTSNAFKEYCNEEKIEHVLITTGVPRGNGQVERINRVIISILTKLSIEKPMEWYKQVDTVQKVINSTFNRSIGKTPFELLMGVKMKLKDDSTLREIVDKEIVEIFEEQRSTLRDEARANLLKVQEENRKTFNKKRKSPKQYKADDLVAIQRTQMAPGLKLHRKFLGPYRVVILRNNRYLVEKIGTHEGPAKTSTSADHMKPWSNNIDKLFGWEDDVEPEDYDYADYMEEAGSIEDDTEEQDGRV